ncbi:MAG: hypothetical protein ACT4P3_17870 [Betaproteobacteria bacterium]
MRSRPAAVAAGLAIYLAVALAFHGLGRLAFGGDVLLNAVKAVVPGFTAAWLHRARGLSTGAAVGIAGALIEVGALAALSAGAVLFETWERLALAALYAVLGSGLTNALGGAAGESLSAARTRR